MKTLSLLACAFLAPSLLFAADPAPKEAVAAAAKKLADQPSYSWTTTVVVPETARFKPGPTEGKTEKDGFTHVKMATFGDNTAELLKKGDKAAITDREGAWRTASELDGEEGPTRFLAAMLRNFKTPAEQAADLLAAAKELKKEGDAYAGDLTEEGVRKQFRFGDPQNPKGSVKFWVKDGMLVKLETKVEAKMEFNGEEFDASRTTTTEIKDAGATKVTPPDAGKKKLS